MNLDKWSEAFEDALRNLGMTEEDLSKPDRDLKSQELVGFINMYLPKHPAPTNTGMINRVVTIMAYMLASEYPAEHVRKLFAGFCQSLISYGWDLGEQCDDERDSLGA